VAPGRGGAGEGQAGRLGPGGCLGAGGAARRTGGGAQAGAIEELCARHGLVVRPPISPAFVVRCVLAAALMPEADWIEVQLRLAGLLAAGLLPRPWHPVGTGDRARRRAQIPVALFGEFFSRVAGPVDDGSGPGLTWRGLAGTNDVVVRLLSLVGVLQRMWMVLRAGPGG
jgi:hypothetical protein